MPRLDGTTRATGRRGVAEARAALQAARRAAAAPTEPDAERSDRSAA